MTRALALFVLLLSPALAAAQSRAPEMFVTVREAMDLQAPTPEARAARILSIEVESRRTFRCNAAEWTVRSSQRGRTIVMELGSMRARRTRMWPCSGPTPLQASIVIATPETGSYALVVRYAGQTDRYDVIVADDALRTTARRSTFSRRRSPELLTRVPRDAIAVFCVYGQNRDDCAPRPNACADFFADPVVASLPPLARPAAPYSIEHFTYDLPHYLAADLGALRARIQEHYRDPTGCLHIQFVSGRGDLVFNR